MSNEKQNNAPAESQPLNMGGVSGSYSINYEKRNIYRGY